MKRRLIVLTLISALLAAIALPSFAGTASAASQASAVSTQHAQKHAQLFDKTRFLLHMGIAFGVFHHFVYKPYKAGSFKKGASARIRHIVAAGIALLFAVHEIHVAYGIAKGSNSKTLQALIKPIAGLEGAFGKIGNKFKKNTNAYTDGDVNALNGSVNSIGSSAKSGGYNIVDRVLPVPGAGS